MPSFAPGLRRSRPSFWASPHRAPARNGAGAARAVSPSSSPAPGPACGSTTRRGQAAGWSTWSHAPAASADARRWTGPPIASGWRGMSGNSGSLPIGRSAPRRISRTRSARATPERGHEAPAETAARPEATSPAATAAARAAWLWEAAHPAPADHPYLLRKQVGPHGLRCDSAGNLIVPLRDVEGVLHTIETITPAGEKRYLAGGAKAGHFCTIGGPLGGDSTFLICEGWATGASLHEATGLPVVAAMDAGNLGPVAEVLRRSYPDAAITIVADNDDKPGREINPGVRAATKAATAIDARLAIPPVPGDANDLAILQGADAVATMVAGAAFVQPAPPTYPEPVLIARGGARRAGAGAPGIHGGGPGLLARRGGGGRCGGSVARHRPAGLQRAADRRATTARPAGGRRARQVELRARGGRDPAGVRSAGHPQGGLRRPAPRPRPGAGRGVPGARRAGDALEGTHGARPHAGESRAADVPRSRGDLRRARGRAGGRAELLQGEARRRAASLPPLPCLRLPAAEGGSAGGAGDRLRPRQPLPHEARRRRRRSACW